MAKLAAVLAVLLGSTLWAIGSEVDDAGACTGFGPDHTFTYAPVVFEGWVREIVPTPDAQASGPNHVIRIEVIRGHRGATGGEFLEATAHLRLPSGVPEPCPSSTPEDLDGKYVIAALTAQGELPSFGGAIYVADGPNLSPADQFSYADALRITELATDSNPDRPLLSATPAVVRCGEPVTFTGERFPEGRYVLANSYGGVGLAQLTVNPSDARRFETTVILPPCATPHPEAPPWVIWASPVVPSTDVLSLGSPEEWVALTIGGTAAEPAGEPLLEVAPGAVCGGIASVTGTGFEPNTPYPILGGNPEWKSAVTDAAGRLRIDVPIPAEFCETGSFQSVWVLQPGFEDFGSRFAIATVFFEVGKSPGPPDVGNTDPHSGPMPLSWLHLAGLAALILGASLLVARR